MCALTKRFGRLQVLCSGSGSGVVTVTSLSSRLVDGVAHQPDPAGRVLLSAAARHHDVHGDAGLLVIALATTCA